MEQTLYGSAKDIEAIRMRNLNQCLSLLREELSDPAAFASNDEQVSKREGCLKGIPRNSPAYRDGAKSRR